MDTIDYLFILTAYIIAAAIKGLTGIGFSTSCLPIMALQLDLKVAIPLVIVPSIISNVTIMIQAGSFRDSLRRFWPLYAASVPGLLIGVMILVTINVDVAKIILGLVLVTYSLVALRNTTFTLSGPGEPKTGETKSTKLLTSLGDSWSQITSCIWSAASPSAE